MKYLLTMAEEDHFARWESASPEHRERVVADFMAFDAAVAQRGSVVAGEALAPSSTARTVRPAASAAERAVTEGPFAETTEQTGGFYVIDVPDLDVAVELAALLPREYSVEVREVVEVELG